MSIALEHLFDYDDFRKFMQDYFDEQKKQRAVFSHRFFAAKAGFSSSSYCLNVIRGRFNLTPKSIEKISKAMDFEPLRKAYFEALVQYNQAQQVDERDQAWEQILQIRKQIEFTHITTREQAYFSKWYYPVVRELAVESDWNGDFRVLARTLTPQITTEEAREAVKNLLEWGLLKRMANVMSAYRRCSMPRKSRRLPSGKSVASIYSMRLARWSRCRRKSALPRSRRLP